MSRSTALILLGVLVILTPLSGLPESWITTILVVFGVAIAGIGFAIRVEAVKRAQQAAPAALPSTLAFESESANEPGPIDRPSSVA